MQRVTPSTSVPPCVSLSSSGSTFSEVAAYEFTTLTCVPGVVRYRGAKLQMLDLPGIIEGAKDGISAPMYLLGPTHCQCVPCHLNHHDTR